MNLINSNTKTYGSNYIFSNNISSITDDIIFNSSDDQQGKFLLYNLLKTNKNSNRYYLIDINSEYLNSKNNIKSNDHTLINIKHHLKNKNINFISTIEFNEDYFNKHWLKSILSDIVNMAILISDDKLFLKETIYENEITNNILPFKNIHFNYSTGLLSKIINNDIGYKYNTKIFKIVYNNNIFNEYLISESKKTLYESILYFLDSDDYLNNWVLFNIDNLNVDIYVFKFDYISFKQYCIFAKMIHFYNVGYKNEIKYNPYNSILESLNYQQQRSDYSLKFLNLNLINKECIKICIKNKKFTCPKPDGFIVEFKN